MADTAAWLVDQVFPDVPVRQFVLSLPFELRLPVARDPAFLGELRRIFVRSCFTLQRRQARRHGIEGARPAAVVSVQRFDSALRLNPHFHALFVDGVFVVVPGASRAEFHPLPPPTDADLARVAARIFRRTLAVLRERGLTGECGQGLMLDERPTALDACQQAAVQGRIAFGERSGCAVRRLGDEALSLADEDRRDSGKIGRPTLQARDRGFSLHAATRVAGGRRDALERSCRYVLRPALDESRLSWTRDGGVVYRFKRLWRERPKLVVSEPRILIEHLAELVSRLPRNRVTYDDPYAVVPLGPQPTARLWTRLA